LGEKLMRFNKVFGVIAIASSALIATSTFSINTAKANEVANFYKGKDITFIVGFSVGG
jgi:hypothetical protein